MSGCTTTSPGQVQVPDHHATAAAAIAARHEKTLARARADGDFPREVYEEMGRAGLVGCVTPTAWGGTGEGVAAYAHVEQLAAYHNLPAPQTAAQGQKWLLDWGTSEQKERYLRDMAQGRLVFCEAISEPGAGSALRDITTTARRDGRDWLITGAKTHVNLGAHADLALVYAQTDDGLSAFLVPTDTPGLRREVTDPIGFRLLPTADMWFDEVRVSDRDMLGQPGDAVATFLTVFNMSRIGNASSLIGYGHRALAEAVAYASERRVGGNVVTDFQGIRWIVAEAEMRLYAAGLARDRAAASCESGADPAVETSLAKLLAIDAAEFATNESFALVGGKGLYRDTEWPQLLHEVKVMRTAGGSREVLRNHVARKVLARHRAERT